MFSPRTTAYRYVGDIVVMRALVALTPELPRTAVISAASPTELLGWKVVDKVPLEPVVPLGGVKL